jgi:hypothetical protein
LSTYGRYQRKNLKFTCERNCTTRISGYFLAWLKKTIRTFANWTFFIGSFYFILNDLFRSDNWSGWNCWSGSTRKIYLWHSKILEQIRRLSNTTMIRSMQLVYYRKEGKKSWNSGENRREHLKQALYNTIQNYLDTGCSQIGQ